MRHREAKSAGEAARRVRELSLSYRCGEVREGPRCSRCRMHGIFTAMKNHEKCFFEDCECDKCADHEDQLKQRWLKARAQYLAEQRRGGAGRGHPPRSGRAPIGSLSWPEFARMERSRGRGSGRSPPKRGDRERDSLFCRPCRNHGMLVRLDQHADMPSGRCEFASCSCERCSMSLVQAEDVVQCVQDSLDQGNGAHVDEQEKDEGSDDKPGKRVSTVPWISMNICKKCQIHGEVTKSIISARCHLKVCPRAYCRCSACNSIQNHPSRVVRMLRCVVKSVTEDSATLYFGAWSASGNSFETSLSSSPDNSVKIPGLGVALVAMLQDRDGGGAEGPALLALSSALQKWAQRQLETSKKSVDADAAAAKPCRLRPTRPETVQVVLNKGKAVETQRVSAVGGVLPGDDSVSSASSRLSICLECDAVLESSTSWMAHACTMRESVIHSTGDVANGEQRAASAPSERVPVDPQHVADGERRAPTSAPSDPQHVALEQHKRAERKTLRASRRRGFRCTNCCMYFESRPLLATHRLQEHLLTARPLVRLSRSPCLICDPSKEPFDNLDLHMAEAHGAVADTTCPLCRRWAVGAEDLEGHLLRRHRVDASSLPATTSPETCSVCDPPRQFPNLEKLHLHQEQAHYNGMLPFSRLHVLVSLLEDFALVGSTDPPTSATGEGGDAIAT